MTTREGSVLSGYRVLDLTDERGQFCPRLLGDWGADVIKIEPPGGDSSRNTGPFYQDKTDPEKSLFWFYYNLNKRGITLNIKTEEGSGIFRRLVKDAAFVIESFEPGYMEGLGLGYPQLKKINPRIVMTSITPFGQTGSYAHYRATDIVSVATGGMMPLFRDADRPPVRISQPQASFHGAIHATIGTLLAHYSREVTGLGQHVDVSIQQAVVHTLFFVAEYWDLNKFNMKSESAGFPIATARGQLHIKRTFRCKDGYVNFMWGGGSMSTYVNSLKAFISIANEKGKLLELKDRDWAVFDIMQLEQAEYDRVADLIESVLLTMTKQEVIDHAVRNGRLLLAPVNTIVDAFNSPQLKERGFWVDIDHPELGDTIAYPGAPLKMSRVPWRVYRRAPLIGEHNDEIYRGELGLSAAEYDALKARGII